MLLLEVNLIGNLKNVFFLYGGTEFGYHFWDDQNQKIIRSKDVIFNEQMLYKDRLGKVSNNVDYEVKMSDVVHLKVFPMNNLQMNVCEVQETIPPEDQENVSPKVNQYTLVTKLRISYRPIRPP